MQSKYLTKSKFKLALECPAKIYYEGKPKYANQSLENSFLDALAEGGFQVGELAKCYFPGGYGIKTQEYDEALRQTNELLKQVKVTIFEAAFCFGNLFIRTDILVKNQKNLELIEVKAKSFDPGEDKFLTKKGTISSDWYSYLAEVAFQKFVLQSAFPDYTVSAYLMLADKSTVCPIDGLNQKFKVTKDKNGNKSISVSPDLSPADLSPQILTKINVDSYCDLVFKEEFGPEPGPSCWSEYIKRLSDSTAKDQKISSPPSAACAKCQFTTTEDDIKAGLQSGFRECWQETLGWSDDDFKDPTVLDIWNYRRKPQCFDKGHIKVCDITEEDITPKTDKKPGLSSSERQWMQVQKVQKHDTDAWIDVRNLKMEMDKWIYPLHFIDFETSMVAIPFNKDRHPYEGIAFQFSHHTVYPDGKIEHSGQYLNTTPGFFPNYEFIRNLKQLLEKDTGSIFRYAAHENTFLNCIYQQLREDQNAIPDRDNLCTFIQSITKSTGSSAEQWEGQRNMVDMLELVKRYYYNPITDGSNSIKYVLPAILNSSKFLQEKYSKPIYGADGGIPSLNYKNWKWIEFDSRKVVDPYKLLPKMFQDVSNKELELLSDEDELRNGGAALTAYARMQFEEMSEYERQEIEKALLKYCELDTFAMVMIYEGWRDLVS